METKNIMIKSRNETKNNCNRVFVSITKSKHPLISDNIGPRHLMQKLSRPNLKDIPLIPEMDIDDCNIGTINTEDHILSIPSSFNFYMINESYKKITSTHPYSQLLYSIIIN